ncbi:serine-rich adhesin for platelets-like [Xiphophorus hellerii]|uniref:serine-rich adhesin for platelets-like n=1 Tax=Xiphophorus hellerii TaxID=8084 RepID=UPI0013B4072D|nr:serine-rich adhesin for platelets-like [Xiphophorus hellerii]
MMLPGSLLCSPDIPSSLFTSLSENDTMAILDKLKTFCNSTENPERSAALASNIKVFTAQTFEDLGNASSGLTNSQILSVSPEVLVLSLSILSSVNTWGQDQASNIIHRITSSSFQINSAASLESLGTLIIGVPSKSINNISASEVLSASKNPTLVSNMLEAPKVVQEAFVKKIISVDSSPAKVVENVPDALAMEIPPSLLLFPEGTANITAINKKTWTADQATMFFATLAEADFDTEQLSPFVLQGFTCGTVKKMSKAQISQLIHACRPRKGRAKVELKEPQLTCMYNLIRDDLSQNFTDYPPDMLLYLDSKNVQKANCRSYFSALGAADFSVASSILNKGPQKFREARDCLGISGNSLSRDNVEVLGNMVCTLNRSDIENSDPLILENLKACKDLSASQVAAMETLLLSGKTQYGAVNSWDQQTLEGLGTLPLYLTRNIWTHFTAATQKRFLKGFMPDLRIQKTQKWKLKNLFSQLTPTAAKREAGCSEGNITQVTVSDPSFPFGYNQLQFQLCLDVPILKDNLYSICQKVDDDGYKRIILNKLNQAFPSGVPDQEVQMLASVSRSATLDDISKWNITELDTLAALMKPEDGTWETAQSKAIITKNLNTSGNSLGSSELNIIDSNLCSLDTSTLETITADSIRNTKLLDVASCSTEQKRVLYEISNTSFSVHRDNPINFFNLVKGYLGGASLVDIISLSKQNISMDVKTFMKLNISVITDLTVSNVQKLMGENLPDLKLFENDTVIQMWVNLQQQSDLDRMGIGLSTNSTIPPTTMPTQETSLTSTGTATGTRSDTQTKTSLTTSDIPALTTTYSSTIHTVSSSWRTTNTATSAGTSTGNSVATVGTTTVSAESPPFTTRAKVSSSTGTSTQDAGTITMLETTVGTSSLISNPKPETSARTSTGDALASAMTTVDSENSVLTATTNLANAATSSSTGGPTDSLTSPDSESTTSTTMPFPTTSSGTMMPQVTTTSGMSTTTAATGSETQTTLTISATTTTKQTLTSTSSELSNTATSPVTPEPLTEGKSSTTSTPDATTTSETATADVSLGTPTKSLTDSEMPTLGTSNSPGSALSSPGTTTVTQSSNYTQNLTLAFLEAVLDKNFSMSAVSDEDFLLWLRLQLRPLLVNLSPAMVIHLFGIVKNRSCNSSQEMISVLETVQMTLSDETKAEIYKNMILFLQDQTPLKCYSGGSFYIFLKNNFLSFGFPDVPSFISLLPPTRKSELLNTISTSELRQFLIQPGAISNSSGICIIFSNYNNTPSFLENEDVPDDVRRIILPCVWPLALSSNRRSEVDLWFNVRLRNYLRFLTKDLMSFNKVQNASCLTFQKLVSFMGKNFTFTGSDFGQPDVYTTIRSYLGAESVARCYNATDPDLNSTSWFVNYIGSFVIFITLDDFKNFVNTSQLIVFLEDKANLELFNNAAIPQDVTDYYILQLYEFYPSFGLMMLPGSLLCSPDIPSSLFTSLSENDTMAILDKLKTFCNSTENPERSAALASNIKVFTAQTFEDLGNASSGLTNSQILSVSPEVLVLSLSILSSVNTWGQDQASNIIHRITSSSFQINSAASLESLGTLIIGVPSKSINNISASEVLSASKNPTLVSNMLEAPKVVQEAFVKKIISVDSSPAKVVENVPDALAMEIPPSLLLFPEGTANITAINKKTWTADQATMFFATLAEADFDTEQLSPFVLQGFTCGTVKKMSKAQISQLIHACRPRKGRAKVELKEPQLTCMYNLIRDDLSQNFTDYPPDMLLYLDSKNVQKANCRSYFSALGAADFSVASSILNKGPQKFREARDCLGISGNSLSRDNVEVLGNMVCTLNRSDIENSDPLILENLKACKDLSASQVAAMETLLLSGKTQYGAVNSWDQQTLEGLGTLPLYLTRNIWTHFTAATQKRFLKGFMPDLRIQKTQKWKLKNLFSQLTPTAAKREAGCSEGNITQVTVSDPSFPFGYNQLQFQTLPGRSHSERQPLLHLPESG